MSSENDEYSIIIPAGDKIIKFVSKTPEDREKIIDTLYSYWQERASMIEKEMQTIKTKKIETRKPLQLQKKIQPVIIKQQSLKRKLKRKHMKF